MSIYERLREEVDDKRYHRTDRSAGGKKTRWSKFAEAKRRKARAQAYYVGSYYARKKE